MRKEAGAWNRKRNKEACKINWRFTTADARIKLIAYTHSLNEVWILVVDGKETLRLSSANIQSSEIAAIRWESGNTGVVSVIPGGSNMEGVVTAHAVGTATVTASLPGIPPVEFTVTVYPKGTDLTLLSSPMYFTAAHNVLDFYTLNTSKTVTVTPVQLTPSEYGRIIRSIDDAGIASVIPNGNTATVTALANGTARITVSHPDIPHTIIITVRAGAEYISKETQVLYFTAASNVVTFTALNSSQTISVIAVQMDPASYSRIVWRSDNAAVASVIPNGNSATITSRADGTALISVSHPDTLNTITIIVRVNSQFFSPCRNQNILPPPKTSSSSPL
jgi:hypothetical protein